MAETAAAEVCSLLLPCFFLELTVFLRCIVILSIILIILTHLTHAKLSLVDFFSLSRPGSRVMAELGWFHQDPWAAEHGDLILIL